jgi:hypothetical protein
MNKPVRKPRKPREKKETKALTVQPKVEIDESIVSSIVLNGDVSKLSPVDKAKYNIKLCESLGLNPYTQPFQILKLQGKEVLYATKAATEQLRKAQGVSVVSLERKTESDICIVTAIVRDAHGRTDAATGAVNVKGLYGDALANAIMKAETKAKRRATLSICGLGFLDESEIETIPGAQPAVMITHEHKREMPIVETVEINVTEKFNEAIGRMERANNPLELAKIAKEYSGLAYSADQKDRLHMVYNARKNEMMEASK